MHDHVALAVGGATAVPATVALVERPRVCGPSGFVARRLNVVMGVEQYGLRAFRRPGDETRQCNRAVDGVVRLQFDVQLCVHVGNRLSCVNASLFGFFGAVYGGESHQLGQLGVDGLALAGDVVSQGLREFLINNAHVRQCRRTSMMVLEVA